MKNPKRVAVAALGVLCSALAYSTPSQAIEKAAIAQRLAPNHSVGFDVYLPTANRDQVETLLTQLHDPNSPSYHKWLTPSEFEARFGPDSKAAEAVRSELSAYGLRVTKITARHFHAEGDARAVEQLFATELFDATFTNGKRTVASARPLALPSALVSSHAAVAGLSGTIWMQPNSRRAAQPDNRYSRSGGYWFDDLKQAYSWPSYQVFSGKGATIGVLMTGDYQPSDMTAYFSHEKLKTPHFSEVKVNGGAPFDPNGGSFETHLDLQQTGGMAPDANIVLYNIPDLSDQSIIAGLETILVENRADVVNMSFSGAEVFSTPAYNNGTDYSNLVRAEDDLFAQGNAQGITFVASSGDRGALGAPPVACFAPDATSKCGRMVVTVEFPPSSPHVVSVGGTNLVTKYSPPSLDSGYISEAAYGDQLASDIFYGTPAVGAWWGSGGGVSMYFKKPAFQNLVSTGYSYRTVPDLALHMGGCPGGTVNPCDEPSYNRSYVLEALAGQLVGVIGTSASSPDFVGLVALKVQKTGRRLGNENYDIYGLAKAQNAGTGLYVFHKNIQGYNGHYFSGASYNLVVGNGTVYGKRFLNAPNVPAAGVPQTPSNP